MTELDETLVSVSKWPRNGHKSLISVSSRSQNLYQKKSRSHLGLKNIKNTIFSNFETFFWFFSIFLANFHFWVSRIGQYKVDLVLVSRYHLYLGIGFISVSVSSRYRLSWSRLTQMDDTIDVATFHGLLYDLFHCLNLFISMIFCDLEWTQIFN